MLSRGSQLAVGSANVRVRNRAQQERGEGDITGVRNGGGAHAGQAGRVIEIEVTGRIVNAVPVLLPRPYMFWREVQQVIAEFKAVFVFDPGHVISHGETLDHVFGEARDAQGEAAGKQVSRNIRYAEKLCRDFLFASGEATFASNR